MRKIVNQEVIAGYLYQHNLELKTVKNQSSKNYGQVFIQGTIDIATDEDALNVLQIHYGYVTPQFNSGAQDSRFNILKQIIEGDLKCWITSGKEEAARLRCTPAMAINDFINRNGDNIAAKRNEGGFINIVNELPPVGERNTFRFDMVITNVVLKEANPEAGIEKDYLTLNGCTFDFRNALLPIELVCRDEGGMNYFQSLDASPSNPVFTQVRGAIVSTTVKREIEEASAFGAASVRTVERTTREWRVTAANPEEYVFGEDITVDELRKAMQDREVHLAEVKKNHDDYVNNRGQASAPAASTMSNIANESFNF